MLYFQDFPKQDILLAGSETRKQMAIYKRMEVKYSK